MNYKSQLKAWAVDRVISLTSATKATLTLEQLMSQSDALVAYAYVGEEDFTDACKRVTECLEGMPDALERVQELQKEMLYIEEQMQAQLSRQAALSHTQGATQ